MSKLAYHRIISLREYKELSQADLAEAAEVEPSYVSKLERGKAPNVSGIVLARIARALETTTDFLLGLSDDPSPRPIPNHPALKDPDFHKVMNTWPHLTPKHRGFVHDLAVMLREAQERGAGED